MIEKILERLEVLHDLVKDNQKLAVSQAISIVQEVAKEYGYTRTLNRCDSCIHYIADKVPNVCYHCCKGMEDNYEAKDGR